MDKISKMSEEERAAHVAANRKRLMEDTPIAKLINESAVGQWFSQQQQDAQQFKAEVRQVLMEYLRLSGEQAGLAGRDLVNVNNNSFFGQAGRSDKPDSLSGKEDPNR